MRKIVCFCAALCVLAAALLPAQDRTVALTPPMGWNSWDAFGFTIDESDFRASVKVLAGIRHFGWQYAVIDEGWYMQDPFGKDLSGRKYLYDKNGLLMPDVKRFPSAAGDQGFKPLADFVHSLGLKFGIHIIRGIPRQVVNDNLPIAGSPFMAADAAEKESTCPWDDANYGVADNAAGQAYYDSMLKRYAQWGLDFIKVDCISDHTYRPTEIRQVAEAIRKSGRPIVLSLSPGPTSLKVADVVSKHSQMWRITDDHWDVWEPAKGNSEFPFGLKGDFDRIAAWHKSVKPGNWPDADMLPEGYLGPHPGWGESRQSRFTHDEQQFEFTLWCMSRSPLIFGGNLLKLDDFSRTLMTNRELIDIDQDSTESNPVTTLPAGFENARVWFAAVGAGAEPKFYFAFFNLDDQPKALHFHWNDLRVSFMGRHTPTNVFTGEAGSPSEEMTVQLPAHGSAVYWVQ
jgi:hypothetical protein